jgi:hypothetical protein
MKLDGYQIINEVLKIGHVPENWEIYKTGNPTPERNQSGDKYDWVMHAGGNDWEPNFKYISVYSKKKYGKQNESTKIWIKVKYPPEIDSKDDASASEDLKKKQTEFGNKVADLWLKVAKELRSQHVHQKKEWNEYMDKENKKQNIARDKGLSYERDLLDIPKYDGNWVDAFSVALSDERIKPLVAEKGIDVTDWIPGKRDTEQYGWVPKEEKI